MSLKTSSLYSVKTEPISGEFFRYIRTKYANAPLATDGSMQNGGRYNVAKLFAALYLGFDKETCEAEVSFGIAAGVPFKKGAFTIWKYNANLQEVLRLDTDTVLTELGITSSEITEPGNHWTASGIGEHLHKRGIEGLVAPSSQRTNGKCLNVYLDNLKSKHNLVANTVLGKWPVE